MKIVAPLFAVLALILIPYAGAGSGGNYLFGVMIPYLALIVFILGFIAKVLSWARSPVPFRITTTCGQGKSMPWIRQEKWDNPSTTWGTIGRMALEVLLFRSLFRNTKTELGKEASLAYGTNKWLWMFAIVFHYSFLVVLLRHYRFFLEPVPTFDIASAFGLKVANPLTISLMATMSTRYTYRISTPVVAIDRIRNSGK